MGNGGFIKLYRSMLDWEWINDSKTLSVFVFCLLSANREPARWRGTDISAGQFVTSVGSISKKMKLSTKSVIVALKHLKTTNEVAITTTNKYTLITVNNWAIYQNNDKAGENKTASNTANEGQTKDKQRATNKKIENIEDKKIYIFCGEFSNVKLTQEEYDKLVLRFGLSVINEYIAKVDNYVESKGKKYSSYYATILSWLRNANVKELETARKKITKSEVFDI